MTTDLAIHQRIHLLNPSTNYIRTENCKFCKLDKRVNYRNRYRTTPRSFSTLDYYDVIEFSRPYEYIDYNRTIDNRPIDNRPIDYNRPIEYDRPIELLTPLKLINNTTLLELSKELDFCSICQDTIETNSIIRKIKCGHIFHHLCCDKWLENNKKCPTCRFNIGD